MRTGCAHRSLARAGHPRAARRVHGPEPATPIYEDRTRILPRARAARRKATVEAADKLAQSAVSVTLCIMAWNDHAARGAVVERTMRRAYELIREDAA